MDKQYVYIIIYLIIITCFLKYDITLANKISSICYFSRLTSISFLLASLQPVFTSACLACSCQNINEYIVPSLITVNKGYLYSWGCISKQAHSRKAHNFQLALKSYLENVLCFRNIIIKSSDTVDATTWSTVKMWIYKVSTERHRSCEPHPTV